MAEAPHAAPDALPKREMSREDFATFSLHLFLDEHPQYELEDWKYLPPGTVVYRKRGSHGKEVPDEKEEKREVVPLDLAFVTTDHTFGLGLERTDKYSKVHCVYLRGASRVEEVTKYSRATLVGLFVVIGGALAATGTIYGLAKANFAHKPAAPLVTKPVPPPMTRAVKMNDEHPSTLIFDGTNVSFDSPLKKSLKSGPIMDIPPNMDPNTLSPQNKKATNDEQR